MESGGVCGHVVARPGRRTLTPREDVQVRERRAGIQRQKISPKMHVLRRPRLRALRARIFSDEDCDVSLRVLERARRGDALLPQGFTGVDLRGFIVDLVWAPVLLVLPHHQGRGAHDGDGPRGGRALRRRGRRPQGPVEFRYRGW